MSDDEFRALFARLDPLAEPRPESVERLLAEIDAVVVGHATTHGESPRAGDDLNIYLDPTEEQTMKTFVSTRAPRSRMVVATAIAAAAAVLAFVVYLAVPGTSGHRTAVTAHEPTTLPRLDPIARSFVGGLHEPYRSYWEAINVEFDNCFPTHKPAPVDLGTCRARAQEAVTATNQLLADLGQLHPPGSLATVPQEFRTALTGVLTGLNAIIAAANASNTPGVTAGSAQTDAQNIELCGPVRRINSVAPSTEQFPPPPSDSCT